MSGMDASDWAVVGAISTALSALLTAGLLAAALVAWRTAKATLEASRDASRAAELSAQAAREANDQAKLDSIEQTRPYVNVEILPGLSGVTCWDVRIKNTGRSTARNLTLDYDSWPVRLDDVATSIKELFETPRSMPPGSSIRAIWRLQAKNGKFTDGTSVAGLGRTGQVKARYSSDDPSQPDYSDSFDVMIEKAGFWPVPEGGLNPDGLNGDVKMFYTLGQVLVRRIGELGR